jgi:hypothetical protein
VDKRFQRISKKVSSISPNASTRCSARAVKEPSNGDRRETASSNAGPSLLLVPRITCHTVTLLLKNLVKLSLSKFQVADIQRPSNVMQKNKSWLLKDSRRRKSESERQSNKRTKLSKKFSQRSTNRLQRKRLWKRSQLSSKLILKNRSLLQQPKRLPIKS